MPGIHGEGVTDVLAARRRLEDAAASGALDALCDRLGVRLLGIFGSAARSAVEPPPRDLDLTVSFRGPLRLLDLIDELTQLTGFEAFDVAVIDGADPVLRAEALVGIPLFESEPGSFAIEQMTALAQRRDSAWLRALELDRLARGST